MEESQRRGRTVGYQPPLIWPCYSLMEAAKGEVTWVVGIFRLIITKSKTFFVVVFLKNLK